MQNREMRIAVLCDIHGNLPALQAVLAEVAQAGVDLVVFGGDVAAGPMPVETIEVLAGYRGPARFVRGNADRQMVESFDGMPRAGNPTDLWLASVLNRSHRDFLNSFEPSVDVAVDGLGPVVCCHAGLDSDEVPIITPATPDEVIAEALAFRRRPPGGGRPHAHAVRPQRRQRTDGERGQRRQALRRPARRLLGAPGSRGRAPPDRV